MARRFFLGVPALLGSLLVACNPGLWLVDRKPSVSDSPYLQYDSAPVIVVGTILANSKVGQPRRASWDEHITVQLNRFTVHVENLLRGRLPDRNIPVYYFAYAGVLGGPAGLGMAGAGGILRIGDREIFFLRPDSGVLRTSCDFFRVCVTPVTSGEHPGFHFEQGKPVAESIVDLLLTRGKNCTDQQIKEAIWKSRPDSFSFDYTVRKLQQMTATEVPAVREEACEFLAEMNHSCVPQVANWRSR